PSPERAPDRHPAPQPGLKAPMLAAAGATTDRIDVTVTLPGAPAGRYLVQVFGNSADGSAEAEIVLGEAAVPVRDRSDGSFAVSVAATGVAQKLRSITATVTSFDGATSLLSAPVPIKESASQ